MTDTDEKPKSDYTNTFILPKYYNRNEYNRNIQW